MQSLEATLSLLAFVSILLALPPCQGGGQAIDDSLYRMQLANDAWRVLYLRGDFDDLCQGGRERLERDMSEIGAQASLCIFFDGVWSTNCRGGAKGHAISATVSRTFVCNGAPKHAAFSVGK